MDDPVPAIAERIVTAVTAETDQEPEELPPLYEAIDLETLITACQVFDTGKTTFQYAGHDVTVSADRTVEVTTSGVGGHRQPGHATSD